MQDIVPIKLYEYAAMRKPIITTDLPGVKRRFGNENGVVYIDRPEDTITKALELADKRSREEMGKRARSFAEQNSWEIITNKFEKILQEVIKERRNGR